MRSLLAFLLIIAGIMLGFWFQKMIVTVAVIVLFSVAAGLLIGPRLRISQRNGDNLAMIAQIERHRYFGINKE